MMNGVRRLLLAVVMTTTRVSSDSSQSNCVDLDWDEFWMIQGEAFHVVPLELRGPVHPDTNITWYKNESWGGAPISGDQTHRIHHQGPALVLLDLLLADSGHYIAQEEKPSGRCYNHRVKIQVVDPRYRGNKTLWYGRVENSNVNKRINCPDPVKSTCEKFSGTYSWYKDFSFLPNHTEAMLWINEAAKDDEGVYTCVCTWTHGGRSYNSSGSREMIHEEQEQYNLYILSPSNREQTANEGTRATLTCSFLCGINVESHCSVHWNINGEPFTGRTGYNQTVERYTEVPSKRTIGTALLTIEKVSAEDFRSEFECVGANPFSVRSAILTLKPRASLVPLVTGGLSVLLFFVFGALLVKHFAVDLTLFCRPLIPRRLYQEDERQYDAYVVYQTQRMDPATEESLSNFVSKTLPSVLERQCGYRLFIQGRDDIPGEDRLEMVEDCMSQSRRLIAILTLGSGPESHVTDQTPLAPQTSMTEDFDWQVGLHHALMQRDVTVILIQLGHAGPQGYTHLAPGLQHLIGRRAPIRWPEGTRGATAVGSRFWKSVRYLMPPKPATRCPQAAAI